MSILIKGMEMPKNCYGCPFFTQVDYWNENDEADILSKCKQTGAFTWESVDGYLPNCPLAPVPTPHGRLIDADEIYDAVEQRYRISSGAEHRCERDLLDLICSAPAIIPAEEENK